MIARAPRISAHKQKLLLKYFAQDAMAWTEYGVCAAKLAKVNKNTANLWYRHFRERIYQSLRRAPRFDGEVEMDQSEFGGSSTKRVRAALVKLKKVMPYSAYMEKAKEIRKKNKTQVFGILKRGGDVYTHIIRRNDARALIPIVRMVVEDSSTVYTDKWRGFADLQLDGYTHKSVNHSLEYKTKDGVHINGIESFWSFAKNRLRKFNGVAMTTLPLHIKECEFRYNNKDVHGALKKIMEK